MVIKFATCADSALWCAEPVGVIHGGDEPERDHHADTRHRHQPTGKRAFLGDRTQFIVEVFRNGTERLVQRDEAVGDHRQERIVFRGQGELSAELGPPPSLADRGQSDTVHLQRAPNMRLQVLAQAHHPLAGVQEQMQLIGGLAADMHLAEKRETRRFDSSVGLPHYSPPRLLPPYIDFLAAPLLHIAKIFILTRFVLAKRLSEA